MGGEEEGGSPLPPAGQAFSHPLPVTASFRPSGPPPPQFWSLWEPDSSARPASLLPPKPQGASEGRRVKTAFTEAEVSG